MAWQSFICSADTHGDIIDKSYERYILQWIKDHKPKHRFMLGDFIDLKALRNGAGEEDRACGLKDDLMAGIRFLRAFKPHKLTLGNHDHRLWVMAANHKESLEYEYARQLKTQVENELKALKCDWVEYDVKKGWMEIAPRGSRSGPKLIGHGYAANMYPAKSMTMLTGTSTLTGHTHAYDYWRQDNLAADESYVSGCGCLIEQDYNRTHRRRLKHCHSFLVGVINDKTGAWQVWNVLKDNETGKWLDPKKMI